MAKENIRVILDTNWYISAAINKKSRRLIYDLLINKHLTILVCKEILNEYLLVIKREKFKKLISQSQATRFINLLVSEIETVKIESDKSGSRDINDNFLLSLAFDGNADYLITGDNDLLILEKTGFTEIVTLSKFLSLIAHKTQ